MKKLMKSVLACALAFAMVLTVMPVNSYAANKKAVVVSSQKQLEKALKSGVTNIVIKTNKSVKITIPASKKAAKATISVQAKNATITNKASVKAIVIKDAKSFVESGKNNDIKITDDKLSFTVAKTSEGADIRIAKKDAEIKVIAKGDVASVTVAKTASVRLSVAKTATVSDINVSEKAADTKLDIKASGKVENVQIDAKSDVAVSGTTTDPIKVTVNAKDTTIKAEAAVDTTLNADAKLDLSKGAEGSKITTGEKVKVDVTNNTTDKVTIKDSTGNETTVDAGKTEVRTDEGKKNDDKKDDQKTDDNSGSVTPAPTPTPTPNPTPTPEYPKVEFTSSDETLTGNVSYNFMKKAWILTVDFLPGDHVYVSEGVETDDFWFGANTIGDRSVTYDDDASEYNDRAKLVFIVDGNRKDGDYTLQFDYNVYYPKENTLIGQKRFTVNYTLDSSQIEIPYAREIMVTSPSTLYVDFSQDVPDDTKDVVISITKEGEEKVVSKIEKFENQYQRYLVTLQNDLEDGTYNIEATFGGKKNPVDKGAFTYDSSVWDNMNAVKTVTQELMDSGCPMGDSPDENQYSVAFKTKLSEKLDEKGVSTENITINVDQYIEKDGRVWIMVYIKNGNAMYTLTGYVLFE